MAKPRRNNEGGFISDDDIAVEIFIRLPDRKSEVNCSLVCKRWFSIIDSIHFRNKKLQRHQSQSLSLPCTFLFRYEFTGRTFLHPFYHYFTDESKILHQIHGGSSSSSSSSTSSSYLDFLPWKKVGICSSSNDLLLLCGEWGTNFMICNPFTKQWTELPQPHMALPTTGFCRAGLICEPIKPQHLNLDLYRYKVMLIWNGCCRADGTVHFYAITYCSEIGEWSESTSILHRRTLDFSAPVACNGLLYWVAMDFVDEIVDGIFAFDLSNSANHNPTSPRFIRLPSGLLLGKRFSSGILVRLGLVRGRLRLSQLLVNKRNGFVLKVWELNYDPDNINDENKSDRSPEMWTLVHDVTVKKGISKRQFVIAFHPENGNVVFLLVNHRHIYQYDIRQDIMKEVGQLPDIGDVIFEGYIRTYTLVHPLWPTPIHGRAFASDSKS